jgi:hypothetical protein
MKPKVDIFKRPEHTNKMTDIILKFDDAKEAGERLFWPRKLSLSSPAKPSSEEESAFS